MQGTGDVVGKLMAENERLGRLYDAREAEVQELLREQRAAGGALRETEALASLDVASAGSESGIQRIVTPEMQETLAVALEEAALRVRQLIPAGAEWDVKDDIDWIWVGPTERVPGMRSPLRRRFDIQW